MGARVVAVGERSVAGDLRGAVVLTGDHNLVKIGQRHPALRDYLYDFAPDVDDLTAAFVGRDEAFGAFRWLQATQPWGVFRVIGDAGLGKSALATEFAGRCDAPVFFCSHAEGRTKPEQCLRHLCADVILRFALSHDHLPERAGADPDFLRSLLREAREKLESAVVVVVDALDEADAPARPGWHHVRPHRRSYARS